MASTVHQSLESNNVNLILPYYQPDDEAEMTAVFKETMTVRKMGKTARDLTLTDRTP